MPALGFGSSVGGRLPDIANFPSSGLVALYKCDERTGDKLYDATGNLTPITLNTGVALDCTTTHSYLVDGTALHTALNGEAVTVCIPMSFTTPALVGAATIQRLIGGATQTDAPVHVFLTESASYTAGNRWNLSVRLRVSNDGGATASAEFGFTHAHFSGFVASTQYHCILKITRASTVTTLTMYYRASNERQWASCSGLLSNATGAAVTFVSTAAIRLLVRSTSTEAYLGKAQSICIANGLSVADAKLMLDTPQKSFVQSKLTGLTARYWDFSQGSGTNAHEWKTDAAVALTSAGTVTWAVAQAGGSQTALRQGLPYSGPAGVRIGGESGFAAGVGYGTSAANGGQILSSPDGWTVIATLRTSNRIPSTDQYLFSVYGPQLDGSYSTTPTVQPGAHLVLDDAGLIRGVFKDTATATAAAGTEQAAGVTADSPSNGLFGTYAIVCSSAGVVTTRRILSGETSVTVAATSSTSTNRLLTFATRVAIGNASFGADLVVGFGAIYNRPITDAEIIQCHTNALSRMSGAEITVLAAATAGNGTPRYPYGVITSAMRTAQPNQVINVGAGTYSRVSTVQPAALQPSSTRNITVQGAGITSTIIEAGAGTGDHPFQIDEGTWTLKDLKLDAKNQSNNAFTSGVTQDIASLTFERVHFYDAKADDQTGTGLVVRSLAVRIIDCESSHNGEHGVYLRVADDAQGWHTAYIDGLYCHDNTEDGLKFASDMTEPSDMPTQCGWENSVINRLKVDGGQNQLWLAGIRNSVVTNCLLLNRSTAGVTSGALHLGAPTQAGTTANEDFCENVDIANVTIYNATGLAVLDKRSEGCTIRNLVCSSCDDDLVVGTEGSAVITYAAGDADSNKLPTHATNIVDATILFTNTGTGDYTLTDESDGYGTGANLWNLANEINSDYAGTARPVTGAWDMGALQHAEA